MRPHSDDKLHEKMIRPLLMSLKMYSPGKVFHAIRHTAGSLTRFILESVGVLLQTKLGTHCDQEAY
jgi:hypothetical protein